jgi:hypothetical protein
MKEFPSSSPNSGNRGFRLGGRIRSFRLFRRALLLACAIVHALVSPAAQAGQTISVPGDAPTIQSGIDIAQDGDMVLVDPGVYNENIDFHGKAITVAGLGGSDATFLAGLATDFAGIPTVMFGSDEGRDSVLRGFSITNPSGIAMYIGFSSPTIEANVISGNTTCGSGTTMTVHQASPRILNNTFSGSVKEAGCAAYDAALLIEGSASSP